MNEVQPIRDTKKIKNMRILLRSQSIRNELLFVMGINVGLRISDLLKMTVGDIRMPNRKIREYVIVEEKKTGKRKKFYISLVVKKLLEEYLQEIEEGTPDTVLFLSRKGINQPITRYQAWRIINKVAEGVGLIERDDEDRIITGEIGTHTLRKTFGYHAYKAGYPVELLMDIFNHSSQTQTLKYIGIRENDKREVYMNLNLGE